MEERNIKQKIKSRYIKHAIVKRVEILQGGKTVKRYEVHFKDDQIDIPLEIQRTGVRLFSSLETVANTVKRIGLDSFIVIL